MYNKESHRFQKLDDNLQDDTMVATMALSLLARRWIKPHIIGITESWANNDITDAELGLGGYAMFRKDRMGRRGGGVLLYIKDTIPAYEVQLKEEADCNEAIWCKLVTGHTTVTIGVVYRCPNITKRNRTTKKYIML